MSLPVIPIVLGLAVLGVGGYVVTHRGSKELPADLKQPYQDLLTKGTDPAAMRQVAQKLDSLGFHKEAANLNARAALLEGNPLPSAPSAPSSPAVTPPSAPSAPAPTPSAPSLPAQFMKVTTSDPAPSGDLALRSAPLDSAGVIGAAEKDSVVTVKQASGDGRFLLVEALNPAGRRRSATGWAHAAFLVPTNPMGTSGRFGAFTSVGAVLCAGAKPVGERAVCPLGDELRALPTYASGGRGRLSPAAACNVISHVKGRSSADPGWCLVECQGLRGWVPSRSLTPAARRAA